MSEASTTQDTYTDNAEGKLARNITTRFFAAKGEIRKLPRDKPAVHWFGEIIGVVYGTTRKEARQTSAGGELGSVMVSYQLMGEFEAVKYASGEISEAGSCYLPNYFAEVIHAMFTRPNNPLNSMAFHVEVGMEVLPDDKVRGGIDVAWTVRHKQRLASAESPLNMLKQQARSNGVATRLPPPRKAVPLMLEGESIPGDTAYADGPEEQVSTETSPKKGAHK